MSYILDALKKSEQARGSRKTRGLLEGPPGESVRPFKPRRWLWPFLIAAILFLNAGLYLSWLRRPAPPGPSLPAGRISEQISAGATAGAKAQSAAQAPQAATGLRSGAHGSEDQAAAKPPATNAHAMDSGGSGAVRPAVQKPDRLIAPSSPAQGHDKQAGAESRQEKAENPPVNPSATVSATAVADRPPVAETQAHDAVQDHLVDNRTPAAENKEAVQDLKTEPARADQAQATPAVRESPGEGESSSKTPDASKPGKTPKSAETKKGLKTANLQENRKLPASPVNKPPRPAAGSGIMSDIQPIAELGAKSSRASSLAKWRDLAPQIRDSIPNLSFSMLIYSKVPDQRWININGSKKHEGDEISAGLKLEEITPDGAVFNYSGTRFFKGVVGD